MTVMGVSLTDDITDEHVKSPLNGISFVVTVGRVVPMSL